MKSLITSGLIISSLAFSGSGAMAADAHVTRTAHVVHARVHVAAHQRRPLAQATINLGQIIASFLGGGWPIPYAVHHTGKTQNSGGESDWSPSYDNSPVVDTTSAATDSQAASDAEVQAIQSMNDTNALNASMAAAEQQNDAANAATLQTEINAGM
jgi:hypothetical protein